VVLPISSQEGLDTKDSKEEEKKPTADVPPQARFFPGFSF